MGSVEFNPRMSLVQAKNKSIDRLKRGEKFPCPCCGQEIKLKKYTYHATMANDLHALYRAGGFNKWVHVKDFENGGCISHNKLWDLVIPHPSERGMWGVTEGGANFICMIKNIRTNVWVFNKEVHLMSGATINFDDARAKPFNLEDVLDG